MEKNRIWRIAFFLIVFWNGAVFSAHAAPLNFSTAESITLSSYPAMLTIATGSVADVLGTNATSVVVTLSQTTGGSFTLLSPSYDFSVATSSAGGSVVISCDGGIETAIISQSTGSTIYTMMPTTNDCAGASTPPPVVVTNSGGSAGGTALVVSSVQALASSTASTPSTTHMTVSQMETLLASLEAKLQTLKTPAANKTSLAPPPFIFARNLSLRSTGTDVKELQLFLVQKNAGLAAQRLAAHGTTMTFGALTYNALVEFQKEAGITPASGYFGVKTRAYVNTYSK